MFKQHLFEWFRKDIRFLLTGVNFNYYRPLLKHMILKMMVFEIMCFVQERILGKRANSNAPWLSSNMVEQNLLLQRGRSTNAAISRRRARMGISSRIAYDNVMYSALVVDKATLV